MSTKDKNKYVTLTTTGDVTIYASSKQDAADILNVSVANVYLWDEANTNDRDEEIESLYCGKCHAMFEVEKCICK